MKYLNFSPLNLSPYKLTSRKNICALLNREKIYIFSKSRSKKMKGKNK